MLQIAHISSSLYRTVGRKHDILTKKTTKQTFFSGFKKSHDVPLVPKNERGGALKLHHTTKQNNNYMKSN